MPAAPPLAKFSLISSYSSKKCLAKICSTLFTKWFTIFFTAGGWRMYSSNLPLSGHTCYWAPFRLSKHRLSNTLSQHQSNSQAEYPSQLEKIARYPKENVREAFLNTYPCANLAYNVISAYLIIWWPGPYLRAELRAPGKTFSPSWKTVLGILYA